jgi:hypothetical protein
MRHSRKSDRSHDEALGGARRSAQAQRAAPGAWAGTVDALAGMLLRGRILPAKACPAASRTRAATAIGGFMSSSFAWLIDGYFCRRLHHQTYRKAYYSLAGEIFRVFRKKSGKSEQYNITGLIYLYYFYFGEFYSLCG